jgi:hypothetical protein
MQIEVIALRHQLSVYQQSIRVALMASLETLRSPSAPLRTLVYRMAIEGLTHQIIAALQEEPPEL